MVKIDRFKVNEHMEINLEKQIIVATLSFSSNLYLNSKKKKNHLKFPFKSIFRF